MADLFFSYPYLEETPPVSGVYLLLFNPRENTAIEFGATGTPYTLQAFDGDQVRFALELDLDPTRTKYYRTTVPLNTITLPTIDEGDVYELEFWERLSGEPDRSVD